MLQKENERGWISLKKGLSFMLKKCAVLILSGIAAGLLAGQEPVAAGYLWNDGAELVRVERTGTSSFYSSRQAILRAAEDAEAQPIPLLTDKQVTPLSGDKRDYLSMAVDYWPDFNQPEGVPYVLEDGRINPERDDLEHYDNKRIRVMAENLRALSRGYAISRQEEFAQRAMDILDAWFITPATRMNPRMEYGQVIPEGLSGTRAGIMDTVVLLDVLDDLEMLQNSSSYTSSRRAALQAWFSAYTDWLRTSSLGRQMDGARNQQGVWYDAQVAAFAHFAGRDGIARDVLQAVPMKRMNQQIATDGSLPLELARNCPMGCSLSALRGYLTLARLGDELGVNLYDMKIIRPVLETTAAANVPAGAEAAPPKAVKVVPEISLTGAIEYMLPYVRGEKVSEKADAMPWNADSFIFALHIANRHYHNPAYELK